MSQELHAPYNAALIAAQSFVQLGDRDNAMSALAIAMQAANKSKDARYRRAVFRAMSFTRRIPVVSAALACAVI